MNLCLALLSRVALLPCLRALQTHTVWQLNFPSNLFLLFLGLFNAELLIFSVTDSGHLVYAGCPGMMFLLLIHGHTHN